MEGHWFKHAVHKGYNYLIVKVGFSLELQQYRVDWSCKLDVFVEK